MLQDAIRAICKAETEAEGKKAVAGQMARESIDEANEAGTAAISKTLARAETEIAHLTRAADKKATEDAKELASKTANRQATLLARAERRLDAAVQLIVERIVKT